MTRVILGRKWDQRHYLALTCQMAPLMCASTSTQNWAVLTMPPWICHSGDFLIVNGTITRYRDSFWTLGLFRTGSNLISRIGHDEAQITVDGAWISCPVLHLPLYWARPNPSSASIILPHALVHVHPYSSFASSWVRLGIASGHESVTDYISTTVYHHAPRISIIVDQSSRPPAPVTRNSRP